MRTVPGRKGGREQLRQGVRAALRQTHSRPDAKARSARSAQRLEVVRSGSQSSAASSGRRKPSTVRGGRPRLVSACAAERSGRASRRSGGVAARRARAAARRVWSREPPSGPGLPGTRLWLRGGRPWSRDGRAEPRGRRGALARARAAVSAPLALRGVMGAPARWWRPSLCSSTPGENGRRASASRPGVRRSSGYEVDEEPADAVEPEAVHLLRRHAAAHGGGGLQDRGREACPRQVLGGRESRGSGPDDDDVHVCLAYGLQHVPLLEVARPVGTSCPRQASGMPEFGSRVGAVAVGGSRAGAVHGRMGERAVRRAGSGAEPRKDEGVP